MEYKMSKKGCFRCGNRVVAPSFSFFLHGHAEKSLPTWSRVVLRLRGSATTTGEKASEHSLSRVTPNYRCKTGKASCSCVFTDYYICGSIGYISDECSYLRMGSAQKCYVRPSIPATCRPLTILRTVVALAISLKRVPMHRGRASLIEPLGSAVG
jgi:hypothetical protein